MDSEDDEPMRFRFPALSYQDYHIIIAMNICVSRMTKKLEGNIEKYAGGEL
jgi:hypothetical protein